MKRLASCALVLLAGVGCLPKSSDGSDDPPGPVAVALQVSPAAASVALGDAVTLTCTCVYSDGSVGAPQGMTDWAFSQNGQNLGLDNGPVITMIPPVEGTITVQATAGGLNGFASLTVSGDQVPSQPGPVHGGDDAGLWKYPAAAGGTPTLAVDITPDLSEVGCVANPSGSLIYYLGYMDTGDKAVRKFNVQTGDVTLVVVLPDSLYDRPIGLDMDSQGRLYTVCFGTNAILRITPSTGAVAQITTIPAYWYIDLAVGPDDAIYTGHYGGAWISRTDPVSGVSTVWAQKPAAVRADFISSGLMFNRHGEAFMTDLGDPTLYRHKDLNGDGDALDAGEVTAWATLWTGALDDYFVFGISAGRAGSVFVNLNPGSLSAEKGIHWLADRDGNGRGDDAGEKVFYSAQDLTGGIDGSPIASPR